jgi:hypothetical protein
VRLREGTAKLPVLLVIAILLAACPAHHTAAHQPLESGPSPQPPPSPDFSNSPACPHSWARISKVLLQPGLTAGGVAVFITLRTTATCRLTIPPGVMILDAVQHLVTFGVASLDRTNGLRANADNVINGEWRDVCTPITWPLRVRILLQNQLLTSPPVTATPPACFVHGAPADPTASPPSGFLDLILGEA